MIHILAIILIIAFFLSYAYFIYALIKAFKEGAVSWIAVALVSLLGALFIIFLSYNINEIEPVEWAQILLLLGLVGITGFYALSATRQANASVKMARETKEQRYSESLPVITPTIIPTLRELAANEFVAYESLVSGNGIKVMWRNVGKGVAINSRFSFWTAPTSPGKATFFPPCESVTLEVGGKKEVDYSEMLDDAQLHEISGIYHPRLQVEYQDIYERRITTVQEFRVDEENRGTFLGELYFTINGRRLGEEVVNHD